jgi:hypothetical protein
MSGTAAYVPGAQGEYQNSHQKIVKSEKTTSGPHYLQYIRSNYGNGWNTWTKHTNLKYSWIQKGDV